MKNVLEYLETTAEKFPDKCGFADSDRQISFQSIMNSAKRIACSLKGIDRNSPVAVMTDRNIKCIEAMLASIYAGCFYTVIDVNSPSERISSILESLSPEAVITDKEFLSLAQDTFKGETVVLYEEASLNDIDDNFINQVRSSMIDTDPLYVLFTSGSSGVPKGAVLSHRSVISYIEWVSEEFSFDSDTVFGSQTPLYFSMSVTDFFSTLKCGGTYVIIPKMLFSFPVKLIEYLNSNMVNTIYWVPSALSTAFNWDAFEYVMPEHLEKVLFAGEVMPVKHLNYWRRFLPGCIYANLFGPTETTDICTFYRVDRDFRDDESLPIGKACDNCDVFLLTETGRKAQIGEEGELVVRGSFLADGYYNDPEKTAAAFPQNPLNNSYPERVYKTGDLAKLNEKGEYIYISRKDFQVKRMGYRIELGEIEAAASSLDQVKSSAALYDASGDRLILVYEGKIKDPEVLLKQLKSKLPSYMQPDDAVRITNMPYNANGKLDRKYLHELYAEN